MENQKESIAVTALKLELEMVENQITKLLETKASILHCLDAMQEGGEINYNNDK